MGMYTRGKTPKPEPIRPFDSNELLTLIDIVNEKINSLEDGSKEKDDLCYLNLKLCGMAMYEVRQEKK